MIRASKPFAVVAAIVGAGQLALGGVVNVETEPTSLPPGDVGNLRKGDTLDFLFYCQKLYGGSANEAVDRAVKDNLKKLGDEDVNLETIYRRNMRNYPVLYASVSDVSNREGVPGRWFEILAQSHKALRETLGSVGRVEFYNGDLDSPPDDDSIIGTGFVVGKDLVMTNRHVVDKYRGRNLGGNVALARINFGRTADKANAESYMIEGVVYAAPSGTPDVALLRVRVTAPRRLPPPVRLLRKQPTSLLSQLQGRRVAVCGYPTGDNDDVERPADDSMKGVYLKMFEKLGVKRVSLGELISPQHKSWEQRLYYNCTTLGGSSGSPVLDLQTGVVWGLHYSGGDRSGNRGNVAYQMSVISQIPRVRQYLEPESVENQIEAALVGPVFRRPSLVACRDRILKTRLISKEWSEELAKHERSVRDALFSTGSISVSGVDSNQGPFGTGFVVSEDSVLTTGSVARHFADRSGKLKRGRNDVPLDARVEFARTACGEASADFKVVGVTYLDDIAQKATLVNADFEDRAALAVLKIDVPHGSALPRPLRLRVEPYREGQAGRPVFVVGYPALDDKIEPELFSGVFAWPEYDIKRLAPGRLKPAVNEMATRVAAELFLPHDCSTTTGNAGSPLVDFETGDVLAIHVLSYGDNNFGITAWEAAKSIKASLTPR